MWPLRDLSRVKISAKGKKVWHLYVVDDMLLPFPEEAFLALQKWQKFDGQRIGGIF